MPSNVAKCPVHPPLRPPNPPTRLHHFLYRIPLSLMSPTHLQIPIYPKNPLPPLLPSLPLIPSLHQPSQPLYLPLPPRSSTHNGPCPSTRGFSLRHPSSCPIPPLMPRSQLPLSCLRIMIIPYRLSCRLMSLQTVPCPPLFRRLTLTYLVLTKF